jgi:hypothetical protein
MRERTHWLILQRSEQNAPHYDVCNPKKAFDNSVLPKQR